MSAIEEYRDHADADPQPPAEGVVPRRPAARTRDPRAGRIRATVAQSQGRPAPTILLSGPTGALRPLARSGDIENVLPQYAA